MDEIGSKSLSRLSRFSKVEQLQSIKFPTIEIVYLGQKIEIGDEKVWPAEKWAGREGGGGGRGAGCLSADRLKGQAGAKGLKNNPERGERRGGEVKGSGDHNNNKEKKKKAWRE